MVKKFLSVVLAVMMVLSIVPATGIQAAAANDMANAAALTVNTVNEAVINNSGEVDYFEFTPVKDGTYVIYSTSDADTSVSLYDSTNTELASDEDSGEKYNFRLQYEFKTGEKYYFAIQYDNASSVETGKIPFAFGEIYTVSYKTDEGMGAPETQIKDYGTDLKLSEVEPTCEGYVFKGWSTSPSANTVSYKPGSIYSANKNIVLYAVWGLDVNPDVFSGTEITKNTSNEAVVDKAGDVKYFKFTAQESGIYVIYSTTNVGVYVDMYDADGVLVPYEIEEIEDEEVNFYQYFTLDAGETCYFGIGYDDFTRIGTIPFVLGETYVVSYNVNGGTTAPSPELKTYDMPLLLETPTRVGYMFAGWATQSNSTDVVYEAGAYYTTNADITLYAVWEQADALTLNSVNNAEITAPGTSKFYSFTPTVEGVYVIYSSSAVETEVALYELSGIEISGNNDVVNNEILGFESERDVRFEKDFRHYCYLFAGRTYYFEVSFGEATRIGTIPFTFGETYTVSYNTTGGTASPAPQVKDYGEALVLNETAPTRVGYSFLGWATSEGSTDVVYKAGDEYTANADVTLYAVWEQGSELTVNSTNNADINVAGESKKFTFTPVENGKYVIYSTADKDVCISLYNYEGKEIATGDDAGEGFNAKLVCNMVAGEKYYFEIKYYDATETGTIPFKFGKVYTVSYKTDNTDGVFATQGKEYGVDLILDRERPTKEGYTLKGWSTSATSSTVAYAIGDTYTTEADVTLYAVWELNTYDVTYNANGGENAPAGQVKTHFENLTLSTQEPTREGYTFKGWSTSANGEVEYAPGATYTAEKAVTLYAVWEINTYTVTYNANGGENAPASQVKTHFEDLTLATEEPTRFGYTFLGWSTDANATVATYVAGDNFTVEADTVLYAVWKQDDVLTVNSTNSAVIENAGESKFFTFIPAVTDTYVIYSTGDADTHVYLYDNEGELLTDNDDALNSLNFRMQYEMTEGEKYFIKVKYNDVTATGAISFVFGEIYEVSFKANGGNGAPNTQIKDFGATLELSETEPTREGYTFLGWSTNPNATVSTYVAGDNFTVEADTILYAVWELNTYDVTYNANGGENAPAGQVKTHFENLTLSTQEPTREGYTFKGWSTSANGEVEYAPGATYTAEKAVTLYAVWEINTYTVTYNANGGENAPAGSSETYGTEVVVNNQNPVREGHTFLGWATSASATTATYVAGDSFVVKANTTLYAVWEINTYTVTYNANGGTNAPAGQVKTYGIDLTLSDDIPTRTGYTFVCWATTAEEIYLSGDKYTINADVTLYAIWSANTYTITYNANGGEGAPAKQTKSYDMALSISGLEPTRDGYEFLGWATKSNATTAEYVPWDIFTDNKDTTLYAVWEKDIALTVNSSNNAVIAKAGQSKYFTFTPTVSGTYVIYSTSDADTRVYMYNSLGTLLEDDDESGAGRNFRMQYNMTAGTTYRFRIKYNSETATGTIPFVFGKVYTVSYNVNGGTGTVYAQSKDYGATLTLRNVTPTRQGYTFLGWATKATATTAKYAAGGSFTANADTVLYAVWGKNGLEKRNGTWYYLESGKVVTSKTGLVKHTNGIWYYVQNGQINWSKTGLVKHTNGRWYYVQKGEINWAKTGLVKHTNGRWYYVQKGEINWSKTGLVKHTNGIWYYVQNGEINWSKTGLVKHTNGKLYYVDDGEINFNYTGFCKRGKKTYYVKKGVVDESFTGTVKYNGKKYKVVKGVKA